MTLKTYNAIEISFFLDCVRHTNFIVFQNNNLMTLMANLSY